MAFHSDILNARQKKKKKKTATTITTTTEFYVSLCLTHLSASKYG